MSEDWTSDLTTFGRLVADCARFGLNVRLSGPRYTLAVRPSDIRFDRMGIYLLPVMDQQAHESGIPARGPVWLSWNDLGAAHGTDQAPVLASSDVSPILGSFTDANQNPALGSHDG